MENEKSKLSKKILIIFGVLFLFIIVVPLIFGNATNTTEKENKVKYDYSWDCTKDEKHEGKLETQIIGIATKEKADYTLEPGTYKIDYKFKEYDNIVSSKKYNRQYIITVLDHYIEIDELEKEENQKFYMFFPDSYDSKELTFSEGEYVYVQHIAVPQAGDGFIGFIKK